MAYGVNGQTVKTSRQPPNMVLRGTDYHYYRRTYDERETDLFFLALSLSPTLSRTEGPFIPELYLCSAQPITTVDTIRS